MNTNKITYQELQELYKHHYRYSTNSREFPVRFLRRQEIFKRMAEDLNEKYNLCKGK